MKYWLFLDDYRNVRDIYTDLTDKNWVVVRTIDQFKRTIIDKGVPDLISFDHDLTPEHYGVSLPLWETHTSEEIGVGPTGYDAAVWFVDYFNKTHKSQGHKVPHIYVHSFNLVGSKKIINYINGWYKEIMPDYICSHIKK